MSKNQELLKTMMIYKPLDKKLELTKVLFKYYITRASETYYENKLIGFAIDWNENSYELTYEDQDRIADIEAQHSGIIDIMRHTKMFVNLVAEISFKSITGVPVSSPIAKMAGVKSASFR